MKPSIILNLVISGAALTAAFLFSSCATQSPSAMPAADSGAYQSRSLAAPARAANESSSARRSPSHSSSRIAKSRPGLGTGWGNQVTSNLGYSSFRRASSKPHGVSSIYYNDKEGVNAMTQSWKYSKSGMQSAANGLIEWGVKGSWGSLKNYQSGGRRYVVGRKGSSYSLVVKNICHSPLEVLLSVDGLDVMDGKSAAFRKRGHIIQPGKTLVVKGFRTSESAVAAFKFSSMAKSYSNLRHGTTRNVGVIGLAVFTQKGTNPWKWSRSAVHQRRSANAFAEAPSLRAR